jgi:outer membrane protein assembly factor BamB
MRVRTSFAFVAATILIAVLFTGLVAVPAAAQYDTMQFRYNAAHTGDYSAVAGSTPNNQLKWSNSNLNIGYSSPTVANGVVYVGSYGDVYAFNATTGAQLWMKATVGSGDTPAVVNGVVYVGDHSGNVYAFNATTGAQLWMNTTVGGGNVLSSPAVDNNVVYVENTGVYSASTNNYGDVVYAFNATTGAQLWKITAGDPYFSSPAVVNNVVYVGSMAATGGGVVYAFNATTGAQLWMNATSGEVECSPAVVNNVVYVGDTNGNFYAFNATTGAQLWMNALGDFLRSSPAVVNGVVYVGDYNENVYALDATTGAQLWSYQTGGMVQSSPAVANGVVYVGSDDHNVYALNATTGAQLWNYPTGGAVDSSPTVVNGVAYVGSNDGNLYAIGKTAATLTATASPTVTFVNQNFTVNGTLNDPNGNAIAGATITLQKNVSGTWNNVTTTVTAANGSYQFSNNESAANTYYYRTAYNGNATYANTTSTTVSVTVSPLATTLNAAVSTTSANATQNFTVNGTLRAGSAAIPGATITLQRSTDNATWTNVTTSTTNAAGGYSFSKNETAAGTYYYCTAYDGNATYANATSSTVSVTVSPLSTTLNASVSTATAYVSQNFTVNGTLNAGTPITGATVTLQKNVSGAWTNVTTNVTNTTGGYSFSKNETAAGTYYYRTAYDGNATYANTTSTTVSITVLPLSTTTLNATVSTTSANATQNFTVNGTLRAGSAAIPGATITLQRSTDNATWTSVTTNTTNATAGYSFSRSETAAGVYFYRTTYAGNTTYTNATSNVVRVTVQQTTLTIAANTTTPKVNQTFNVTGVLTFYNGTSSTALVGKPVYLEGSYDAQNWFPISANDTTNATGTYGFHGYISAAGTFYIRADFDGTTTYPGCVSPAVTVVVS